MTGIHIEAGEYMTPKQIKEALGVSAQRVSELFKLGQLPYVDLGSTRLVRVEHVGHLLEGMREHRRREIERLRHLEERA